MEFGRDTAGVGGAAVQSERKRFFIELKPGETTIVSWKKLIHDNSGDRDSPPPIPLHECIQEEKSRGGRPNFLFDPENKGKKNESSDSANYPPNKRRNDISEVLEENDDVHLATKHAKLGHTKVSAKNAPSVGRYSIQSQGLDSRGCSSSAKTSKEDAYGSLAVARDIEKTLITTHSRNYGNDVKVVNDIPHAAHQKCGDKTDSWSEPESRTLLSDSNKEEHAVDVCQKNNGRNELPDLNLPCTVESPKTAPIHVKDAFGSRVTGTMLARAIQELERVVGLSRLLHSDVQYADHSLPFKRRVPRDIRQKLAKVARLEHSSQGKISDELINHLMSILGDRVQQTTLKRYLRKMASEGLPASKEEEDTFGRIKKEIIEMIKLPTSSLKVKACQDGSSYSMDYIMEDKICDLYDIYVQGMDEVKIPEIRKFYNEIAGLWPNGCMDSHGIRNAICRVKERRRMLFEQKVIEKCKKNKLPTPKIEILQEAISSVSHPKAERERPIIGSNGLIPTLSDSTISSTLVNLTAPPRRYSPPSTGSCVHMLKQGRFEISEDSSVEQIENSVNQLELWSNTNKLPLKRENDSRSYKH